AADGGTRQISLGIAGDAALTLPLNQAHLISGNLAVATVSADGIVTGVGAGQTTITAIFGPAEAAFPVRVAQPVARPTADLGPQGGVVRNADGAQVAVPPGVLGESTPITLRSLAQADFSLPLPDDFHFLAGFDLDVGPLELAEPVQLVIPVGPDIAPGTPVWF